jgi:hypothetical protein
MTHGLSGYRAGCKCLLCRAAWAEDQAYRRRFGPKAHHALVSALPSQEHLVLLAARGVGYRQAARLARLSPALVRDVRSGRVARIRQGTAARILAVTPSLAMWQRVPSWPIRRTVQAIEREGLTRADIIARLGLRDPEYPFDTETVRVRTALKVRALYREVTEEGPEEPAA